MGVNRILINPFLSREMHSSSKKWLMGIRLTISQMEECIFLDKKGLMRIRLTISQMEECIFLDKKGLMQLPTLMTPPGWRSASEWEEQDPEGDVCSIDARQLVC